MSIVKSFSVDNGDMFYVKHNSDNFTIIDCHLADEETKETIVDEIIQESSNKGISRFISTHPDEDHICGLTYLDKKISIQNFYCVKNETTKKDKSDDFIKYCELRDNNQKVYYIYKGCSRKWMNDSDDTRGSSGITILWPDTSNSDYIDALNKAKNGESPNNISPIIQYSLSGGVKILWMGDLETEFMEKIEDQIEWPSVDILFAPHHGRSSGKVPGEILRKLDAKITIIGEAPSKYLNYYQGYNTITQNLAGSITLDCQTKKVHIYVSNEDYSVDYLDNEHKTDYEHYIGTLNLL